MDFLVQITVDLPADMASAQREALVAKELVRGRQLASDGTIQRIWRLPGQRANIGIWTCDDADRLHEAIASLPAWPWTTVIVTALAVHPVMA